MGGCDESMKRRFLIVLLFVLLLLCIVGGCGRNEPPDDNGLKEDAQETPIPSVEPQANGVGNGFELEPSPIEYIRIAVDIRGIWEPLETVRTELNGLGIKMDIVYYNNSIDVYEAFLRGDVNSIGSSVAMLAQMETALLDNGRDGSMICVIAKSSGADVVLSREGIYSINDLLDARGLIGFYYDSDARDMLLWEININESINAEQRESIDNSFVWFNNAAEAHNAFVAGELDALCTSEIILGKNILLSSEEFNTVIVYGIVFEKSFIESNRTAVNHLLATMMRVTENASDIDGIATICMNENYFLFGLRNESGRWVPRRSPLGDLYVALGGSEARRGVVYANILGMRSPPIPIEPPTPPEIIILDRNDLPIDPDSGMSIFSIDRSYSFHFHPNRDTFLDDPDPTESLQRMFNDLNARGDVNIIIFGHVANTGIGDTPFGRELSLNRALAVANRLVDDYGVSPGRITVVGMGNIASASFSELYRRVDVAFFNS
jgi:hypothetical protein